MAVTKAVETNLGITIQDVPTDAARLCLAWARGPAHVAHACGQYKYLSIVHTASALVSGVSLLWYHEFRLASRQNTTNGFGSRLT